MTKKRKHFVGRAMVPERAHAHHDGEHGRQQADRHGAGAGAESLHLIHIHRVERASANGVGF